MAENYLFIVFICALNGINFY